MTTWHVYVGQKELQQKGFGIFKFVKMQFVRLFKPNLLPFHIVMEKPILQICLQRKIETVPILSLFETLLNVILLLHDQFHLHLYLRGVSFYVCKYILGSLCRKLKIAHN